MIGEFNASNINAKTDLEGNATVEIYIPKSDTWALVPIITEIRKGLKEGKELYKLSFNWHKKSRSLDQNALMWKLLTIYAETQGGIPEDIYVEMLSRYGVADFVQVIPEAVERLKRIYKETKIVDTRTVNGKEVVICKCYYGSSTYDVPEMSKLIDGIFNELATLGVDAKNSTLLSGYRKEWNESKVST